MPYALPRYEQVIVAGRYLTLSPQLYELEKGTFMVVYILITCGCKTMNGVFAYASWAWALFDYTAGPQLQEWHFILIWLAIHSSNQMRHCLNEV